MSCTLKVYGRLRPSANYNEDMAVQLVGKQQARVCLDGKSPKLYELHRFFDERCTQEEVFNTVAASLVKECTEGINGTIFAYGQTGSGKTHTMLGPSQAWSDPEVKGLIPRSIEMLFDHLEKRSQECQQLTFNVSVQFVELYNNEIFDLLSAKSKITLSDTGSGVRLLGAKTEQVETSLDLMHVVKTGWTSRSTGATAMNRDSSRSHAVLIVRISTVETTGDLRTTKTSTLNLVDLAGSERQAHTKATGERFKEATNINGSLTVLGRVIRLLAKPTTASSYIPYRDCHLTHILKNSLGGNSKTAVIVNMHPDKQFELETASTLQFAETCTFIKNKVQCNVEMSGDQESSYKNAIRALRLEIEVTRAKTREEFAKRLEALSEENAALKTENFDMRAKYNLSLIKYATNHVENPATTSHFTQLFATTSLGGSDPGDLRSKLETVALELDASETRCQKLQKELDDLRDRFQERLNISFQAMTPGKPRRSSSRSQRRETQYFPSPARLAEISQQRDEEELLEMQMRLEQTEMEAEKLRSQLEQAKEEKVMVEALHDEEKAKLTSRYARLEEELVDSQAYGDEMAGKVADCRKQLDKLLQLITEKDATISKNNADLRELEKKWSSDMDDMQKHYESLIAEREEKIDSFQQSDEQRQMASGALEAQAAEAAARIVSLQDELVQKKSKLQKAVAEAASRHDNLVLLQSDFRRLKLQLEESQMNEERVQRALAVAKEQQQSSFDNFQKEIAAARAKARKEVEDREESIALLKKALESKDELSEKLKSDASKRFDEKITELKASFAVQKKEAIEESVDDSKRATAAYKKQIAQLQEQINSLQKMRDEDSALIQGQLTNKTQKHGYVDKLRREAVEKDAEIASLRMQLQKSAEIGRRVLKANNK